MDESGWRRGAPVGPVQVAAPSSARESSAAPKVQGAALDSKKVYAALCEVYELAYKVQVAVLPNFGGPQGFVEMAAKHAKFFGESEGQQERMRVYVGGTIFLLHLYTGPGHPVDPHKRLYITELNALLSTTAEQREVKRLMLAEYKPAAKYLA